MKIMICAFVLLALILLPVPAAYAADGVMDGRLIIGQNFTLRTGETVEGNLVVIGGEATIESGAIVKGDTVLIGGSLRLDGEVTGSTVVIGGTAFLGERASVADDVITLGGALQREPGARIGGDTISNLPLPTFSLPSTPAIPSPPLSFVSQFPRDFGLLGTATKAFFQALGMAALAMLLTAFLHPQIDRVGQAVVAQPFVTGSIGLLTAMLAPITIVILAITLILIPLAFAVVLLLVLAWLFGAVALGTLVGERLTQAIHKTWEPVLSAGLGTLVLWLVLGTVNSIPCVGWLASAVVALVGLGGAVTTMLGTRPGFQGTLSSVRSDTGSTGGTPPSAAP